MGSCERAEVRGTFLTDLDFHVTCYEMLS